MAKGQKRGNREMKKPKAAKPSVPSATAMSARPAKGFLAQASIPLKKR